AETELRASAGQTTSLAGVGAIFEWWLMKLLTLRGDLDAAAERMESWLADPGNSHRNIVMNGLFALNRQLAGDAAGAEEALAVGQEAAWRRGGRHCELPFAPTAAEMLAQTADPERVEGFIKAAHELGDSYGRETAVVVAERAQAVLDLRAGDAR